MGLFLAQLCMLITPRKMLEISIPFKQIFFNTSLIVSQKHKCISIVVLLVFNFKNASRLYGHPILFLVTYNQQFIGPTQRIQEGLQICPRTSVLPSNGFRSNRSIVFSDFWHQGSFLWFQKTDEAGFLKKKFFWPKMAKKV